MSMKYLTSCLTNVTPSLLLSQKQLTLWLDLMGKKNCSSVCFLFLLLLFGELFKIQLLKLKISPSPSWSYSVASKICNLWIVLSWNRVCLDSLAWNLAELYSRSRDLSHMAELYEAVVRNSCWSAVWFQNNWICMNAVGGDQAQLTEWIMSQK